MPIGANEVFWGFCPFMWYMYILLKYDAHAIWVRQKGHTRMPAVACFSLVVCKFVPGFLI